jgi:hypothetical protein
MASVRVAVIHFDENYEMTLRNEITCHFELIGMCTVEASNFICREEVQVTDDGMTAIGVSCRRSISINESEKSKWLCCAGSSFT